MYSLAPATSGVDEKRGLMYDRTSRSLLATEGGRLNGEAPEFNFNAIVQAVRENPGLGKTKLFDAAKGERYGYTSNIETFLTDIAIAVEQGLIENAGTASRPKYFVPAEVAGQCE